MNIRKLMNETLVANNGELSRGLKNQLSILPAITNQNLEEKIERLKKENIMVYSYYGLRILGFNLSDIEEVLKENMSKKESYQTNPQELVRDIRKKEIEELGSSLKEDMISNSMNYLEKFEFTKDQMLYLDQNTSRTLIDTMNQNQKLLSANLKYLFDLGVTNYREIFLEYYDLFLLDNSTFVGIFNKYDREDLVDKLEKNAAIIEYL